MKITAQIFYLNSDYNSNSNKSGKNTITKYNTVSNIPEGSNNINNINYTNNVCDLLNKTNSVSDDLKNSNSNLNSNTKSNTKNKIETVLNINNNYIDNSISLNSVNISKISNNNNNNTNISPNSYIFNNSKTSYEILPCNCRVCSNQCLENYLIFL